MRASAHYSLSILNTLSTFTNAICAPQIVMRSSDAIDYICVDVMTKACTVMFTNGGRYEYTNVSRRAMINLLKTRTISLGMWVNQNCINKVNVGERHLFQLCYA